MVKPSVEQTELVELSVDRLDTVLNPTTIESACSKGRREFRISASSLALEKNIVSHNVDSAHCTAVTFHMCPQCNIFYLYPFLLVFLAAAVEALAAFDASLLFGTLLALGGLAGLEISIVIHFSTKELFIGRLSRLAPLKVFK